MSWCLALSRVLENLEWRQAEMKWNFFEHVNPKGSDVVPICRVPLITSQREEQALITANNMKPVVKLLINR